MGNICIRKRGNYYEYRVEIAHQDNTRKWISKSGFNSKQEAYESGTQAYNEYLNAGVPFKASDISYSDYLDYWMDNYCLNNLKYNTIMTYKIIINKYLKPYMGKYKLSTITIVSINLFITDLVNKFDHSKSYFKNILKVIKGSFRDACNIYGFIKYNPAQSIRLPKIDRFNDDIKHLYTKEEIDLILNRFKDNKPFICAFLVSCLTGMRTGEVFALTWNDIDLDNNIINVKHSIYDKPKDKLGRWYLGTTKTPSGTRKVYIGNILKEALLNYKKRQNYLKQIYGFQYKYYHLVEVKNEYGKVVDKRIVLNKNKEDILNLVFIKDDGLYIGTDLIKYPYKIIHNELGIDKCRFYDLRGTYATNILNNGSKIREVADILGHKSIETTETYYISSIESNKRNAVDNYDKTIDSEVINSIIKFKI